MDCRSGDCVRTDKPTDTTRPGRPPCRAHQMQTGQQAANPELEETQPPADYPKVPARWGKGEAMDLLRHSEEHLHSRRLHVPMESVGRNARTNTTQKGRDRRCIARQSTH